MPSISLFQFLHFSIIHTQEEGKEYEKHIFFNAATFHTFVLAHCRSKKINRPLAEAHVGLGVTDAEFDIVAGHLGTTLKEFKVPQKELDELMTKVGGLRDYVVEARIKK